MELKLLTREQLKLVYDRDLTVSFPRAELKPFRAMEQMQTSGTYKAWGLMDGEDIVGVATVWSFTPGWALFDYLCVAPHRRADGLGGLLVQKVAEAHRHDILFGESEVPDFAPDRDMARRRLDFYRRSGAREAGYDMTLFGVPFRVVYWGEHTPTRDEIAQHHSQAYHLRFPEGIYDRYINIPWTLEQGVPVPADWQTVEREFLEEHT